MDWMIFFVTFPVVVVLSAILLSTVDRKCPGYCSGYYRGRRSDTLRLALFDIPANAPPPPVTAGLTHPRHPLQQWQ